MLIKDGTKIIVDPPQELTIRTVKEFHEEVNGALDECEGILVNLIGVIEIDTAGFQMIVALKNEMTKQNKSFGVIGMSTEADEMVSLYGAGPFFLN
jgi:anti-anti-sigma regulatory factor